MKKLFLFFAILINIFAFCQNFGYDIVYKVTYRPQKGSNTKNVEYMTLKVQNSQSNFYNSDMKKLDSLVINNESGLDDKVVPKLNFQVSKDLSRNKILVSGNFNDFKYTFEEPRLIWKLSRNPSVKIRNYNVKSANTDFGGRNWYVQYTEEIPIFDGPYVFNGLPGFIIFATSLDGQYDFDMISITKNIVSQKIVIPNANISKEKIQRKLKEFIANPENQNILYKNIWGDTFYFDISKSNPKATEENKEKIKTILEEFNNPPDKNIPIINLNF